MAMRGIRPSVTLPFLRKSFSPCPRWRSSESLTGVLAVLEVLENKTATETLKDFSTGNVWISGTYERGSAFELFPRFRE